MAAQKVHIKSFGCQMNVYDATRMADTLVHEGYTETADVREANLVILNTCHIRERASEKVYSELGRLKQLKHDRAARGQATLIAVAGCVAQAEGAEIIRRQKSVDIVIGTQSYHRFPEALALARTNSGIVINEFGEDDKFDQLVPPTAAKTRARGVSAFVTIQEGCDKFCTFCVVPYTRGIEVSRPAFKILEEIERLAAAGVREVTLLGQNVNAYHGVGRDDAEMSLAKLIKKIALIPDIARIRYTTSHPNDMRQDLIDAHREEPKLMPYVHLPVQSGSDRVLKAMNRRHLFRDYIQIVERLRRTRPDVAMSSDFIVGFPGETGSDFKETIKLVRAVEFASAFSFKYSRRPGTPASSLGDHVDENEKADRLTELHELLERQRRAFNAAMVGQRTDVFFEKLGRHENQIVGKSPYMQAVFVEGASDFIGEIKMVDIVELRPNALRGRIVSEGGQ